MMKHMKYMLCILLCSLSNSVHATQNQDALLTQRKVDLERGFQAPSFLTNFQSETLFSGATMGNNTMHVYKSGAWRLTRPISYIPASASATPVIKVTGSAVVIDLNGMTISNASAGTTNVVGIEIGYNPADAEFATTAQPQNVIIKNGTLQDFMVGIVINAGVKNVVLENITIVNSPVGVVCAGRLLKKVDSVYIKNVQISGDGTDRSEMLEDAKTMLETTMNYGGGTILSMPTSPVTAEGVLWMYTGILVQHANNVLLENVGCKELGFSGVTAEAGEETGTYAIDIKNSTNIFLENVEASFNHSQRLVVGVHITGSSVCSLENINTVSNIINAFTGGGGLFPDLSLGCLAQGISIDTSQVIVCKNIAADKMQGAGTLSGGKTTAMGIYLKSVDIIELSDVSANYNDGFHATLSDGYGLDIEICNSVKLVRCSANYNQGAVVVRGIQVSSAGNDFEWEDVQACKNEGLTAAATVYGINSTSGQNWIIKNIQANANFNNTATASGEISGIRLSTVTNVQAHNIQANQNTVLQNDATSSVYGLVIETGLMVSIDGLQASENNSRSATAVAVGGVYCHTSSESITLQNVEASKNTGGLSSFGISILGANQLTLKNVQCKRNSNNNSYGVTITADGSKTYGIRLDDPMNAHLENVDCSYNVSANARTVTDITTPGSWNVLTCAGLWMSDPQYVFMKNIVCDNNKVTGTSSGAYAFGILIDNPMQVDIDGFSASGNAGNATGAGVFVYDGENVTLKNGMCNNNSSVSARVQLGASAQITPNGNISKHTVLPSFAVTDDEDDQFDAPNSLKGSYGVWIYNGRSVLLDNVQANRNTGFRAFGFALQDCRIVNIQGCETNGQIADGVLFLDSAAAALTTSSVLPGDAVPIIPVSGTTPPDIFGTGPDTSTDTVDLQSTIVNLLFEGTNIKDDLETDPPTHTRANESNFAQLVMLARNVIAQWRAWGVSVGVQCNNCFHVDIQNHRAIANRSVYDSAFGILFANRCSDCSVQNSQCNSNRAWSDSELNTTAGTVNVTGMDDFWTALDITDTSDAALTGALDITGGPRFLVELVNESGIAEFLTPCGPIAAGIVIGDTSEFIDVSDCVCSDNQGNAGHAYGLLHDASTGSTVKNCEFYLNRSNMLGIAFGLAEYTVQSSALQLSNLLYGNQYYIKRNANYLVPFPSGKAFPLLQGESGNIVGATFNGATDLKNIEMIFTSDAPSDIATNLPDGVFEIENNQLQADISLIVANQNGEVLYDFTDNGVDADISITSMRETTGDGGTIALTDVWDLTAIVLTGSLAAIPQGTDEAEISVSGTGTVTGNGSNSFNVTLSGSVFFDVNGDASAATLGTGPSYVYVVYGGLQIARIEVNFAVQNP